MPTLDIYFFYIYTSPSKEFSQTNKQIKIIENGLSWKVENESWKGRW